MPRIAPIPMDQLSTHSRHIVEAGVKAGLYATPVPLQIFAYRSAQLAQVDMARTHLGADTLLGGRILELLRIRSAQLGECEPCSQSRKHDSITDEDVVCLLAPERDSLTPQEQMAVEFLDRLSGDHHSIDDDFYRRLGEHFTAAQIVELGFTCATTMGLHRFLHTLDVYGDSIPVIDYSPGQVDSAAPR
ncbi:MAG: carboxymuconolactone decarboxylase family protein [Mycobacterium sp.]|uniref:carboxymuconolactone decarboxylase family protein n=1 Tax=Mycobacterium sp. TaxID=1785 RepID=UPI003BB6E340